MKGEKKKGSELYLEIKNVALELDMTYKNTMFMFITQQIIIVDIIVALIWYDNQPWKNSLLCHMPLSIQYHPIHLHYPKSETVE